jgi:hypothetical protein
VQEFLADFWIEHLARLSTAIGDPGKPAVGGKAADD